MIKKIVIFLSILAILLACFCPPSLCVSFMDIFPQLPTDLEYYCVVQGHIGNDYTGYSLICSDKPLIVYTGYSSLDIYGGENIRRYMLNETTNTWEYTETQVWNSGNARHCGRNGDILYSNHDIYYNGKADSYTPTTDLYFAQNLDVILDPYIENIEEELLSWNFDKLKVNSGSYSSANLIRLHVYYANPDSITWIDDTTYTIGSYVENKIDLNYRSAYFDISQSSSEDSSGIEYLIPRSHLFTTQTIRNDGCFWYKLAYYNLDGDLIGTVESKDYIIGSQSTEKIEDDVTDKTLGKLDEQTDAIKEQTEVNKGIFESIGEVLSYINPLSENFFVYKLIELLLDALKSLFIPSDDFFTNWFDDLNEWLGDRFGILYFPIEIVLDFLNRVGGLSDTSEYILHVPKFELNFMGYSATIFEEIEYDFNSLLANETFENVHKIYLTIVDVILYICLIVLCVNTFTDVFGGRYIDDTVEDVSKGIENHNREKNKRSIGFNTDNVRRR